MPLASAKSADAVPIVPGFQCGACAWAFPAEYSSSEQGTLGQLRCPGCGQQVQLAVFPAMTRRASLRGPEAVNPEAGEAHCFYHSNNQAVCPCDECGRFLCGLCELDVDGRKLCPACLEAGVRGRKNQNLETNRKLHDNIALAIATYPALMFWPIIVSAPATIYYCIRYWKAPGSLLPRTKFRFYLAIFFAISQIAFIIFMMVVFSQIPNPPTPIAPSRVIQ